MYLPSKRSIRLNLFPNFRRKLKRFSEHAVWLHVNNECVEVSLTLFTFTASCLIFNINSGQRNRHKYPPRIDGMILRYGTICFFITLSAFAC